VPFRHTLGLKTQVFFKQHIHELAELGCKQHLVNALSLSSQPARRAAQRWQTETLI